jgi:long-subunit acyl-CoA synthetase (AMP-forming)/thioester reductase-like protein
MIRKLKGLMVPNSLSESEVHKWERHFWCNCCVKPIEGERHSCSECESADWCARCADGACACAAGGVRSHRVTLRHHLFEDVSPLRGVANKPTSNAATLDLALRRHATKLCVADAHTADLCDAVPLTEASSTRWLTFARVHLLASRLAFALDRLAVRGAVVVASEPRVESAMLFDFAMVLRHDARDLFVPVAKSASARVLRIVCERCAPLGMLVCTAMTRDAVHEALRDLPAHLRPPHLLDLDAGAEFARLLNSTAVASSPLYPVRADATVDNGTRVCVFSSGSTGDPKGVVHTSRSWQLSQRTLTHLTMPWVGIAWQPLPSLRRQLMADILGGGRIYLVASAERLRADLRAVRPTVLSSTPRFWGDLHSEYEAALAAALPTVPRDDERALGTLRERCALAVFRDVLGGRVRVAATGGAPTPASVKRWLQFLPMMVHEGYGLSECTSVLNEAGRPVSASVLVRLEPVPQLELDGVTRGEIVVRSDTMFEAYVGDAELTRAAFTADQYYRTGDLASYDAASARYTLIGRLSNAKKLAQGVFVSVERIETTLAQSALVRQICVHADGERDHVVALVVPTAPDVTEPALLDDFRRLAREHAFEAFEMPRAVAVLRGDGSDDGDFTVDNGCLTGTGKLARVGVQRRFGAALAALYARTRATELAIEARGGARSLADILSLLGHTDIAVAERFSFRQLGGDSIAAVRCAKTLRIDAAALLSDVPLATVLTNTMMMMTQQQMSVDDVVAGVAADDNDNDADGSLVLVTGASGFLGKFIVNELLSSDTTRHVMAMVRAADDAAARARLATIESDRVTVVAGDLSQARFGWSEAVFEARRRALSAAVHNGACVNASLGADALRAVNVGGTASVLQLIGRKPLVYVSTIGVLHAGSSGYAQTKSEAEQLVRGVRARLGVGVGIVRPGAIGPARDGTSNPVDFRVLLAREMLRQAAAPRRIDELQLRFVGVECVAKRCVQLLQQAARTVELPLVAPRTVAWRAVVDEIARRRDAFRRGIDMKEWCDAIENAALRQLVARGLGEEPANGDDNDLESFDDTLICKFIDKLI